MKRRLAVLGVIFLIGCKSANTTVGAATESKSAPVSVAAAPSFQWAADYDQALATAKGSKKIVMVDVYTDWCVWCKVLDKQTFADHEVMERLAKDFIAVKLNPEQSDKNVQIAKQFGAPPAYPLIIFVDENGKKIHQVIGFRPPKEFLKELDMAASKTKS